MRKNALGVCALMVVAVAVLAISTLPDRPFTQRTIYSGGPCNGQTIVGDFSCDEWLKAKSVGSVD